MRLNVMQFIIFSTDDTVAATGVAKVYIMIIIPVD